MSRKQTNKTYYYLKNRLFFGLIYSILTSVIIGFIFFYGHMKSSVKEYNKSSYLLNSTTEFNIPSPTPSQLNDILAEDFVDSVFGYYYSNLNILSKEKNLGSHNFVFGLDFDNLNITMWSDERLIESSNKTFDNPVYVGYDFAIENGLKIGDVISINIDSKIDFTIERIYETNFYYNKGALLAKFEGEQKTQIENKASNDSLSGAFLKSKSYSQLKVYLNSYKPLGRLLNRDNFNTEEEYQIHYNSWSNGNYINEITDFKIQRDSISTQINNSQLLTGNVILFVIVLGINLILLFRKSEHKYFTKIKSNKKEIKKYYINALTIEGLALIVGLLFVSLFGKLTINEFIPAKYILKTTLLSLIGVSISLILSFSTNMIVTSKKHNTVAKNRK